MSLFCAKTENLLSGKFSVVVVLIVLNDDGCLFCI